ncbi:MAG: hypothetical protein AB7K63_20275 [Vicinamibacterales bacterium]
MTRLKLTALVALAMAASLAAFACGGGSNTPTSPSPSPGPSPSPTPAPSPSPTPTPSPSPAPGSTATITITSAGASPRSVTIAAGGRVTFVNNDSRAHDMSSDPHPEHTDCPAINQAGFLAAGQSRATGNLTTVRTCGFHDHDQPTNTSLQGTIVIR